METCPTAKFADSNFCKACDSSCASCARSATNCLTCASPKLLDVNSCVSICPVGKFSSRGACSSCDQTCASCSGSATNCSTCPQGQYLKGSQCIADCGVGFYHDLTKCLICDSSCSTCNGAGSSNCLSCSGGLKYDPDSQTCAANCVSTKYFDFSSNTCKGSSIIVFAKSNLFHLSLLHVLRTVLQFLKSLHRLRIREASLPVSLPR